MQNRKARQDTGTAETCCLGCDFNVWIGSWIENVLLIPDGIRWVVAVCYWQVL
ncbi:hypothetical protein SERLA73DRAFT_124011 [Serpula lacrymans var. lacrymans S7.3]|uniref:Uncharacterized protein n=2 Tax=Serpula lacrymans var. lacrymans TaxID=341189 RepID=F8Q249_SERL3|nr:hypothetical protein SERLA73DRAFT_124011 [Serpula lacrymans var. lacrymans S7.3]